MSATFGHGSRRTILVGTVASPVSPAFDLKPYVTDVSGDVAIDTEEQTTLAAQDIQGAKTFLYGNNGETGELQVQFDREGELIFWLEDIKAQGVEDSDFNVMVFDYPFGNVAGRVEIKRPIKINSYRSSGGINSKVAGSISFTRSGEPIVGLKA